MKIAGIVAALYLLFDFFIFARLIYWQRRHINALKEGIAVRDEGIEIRERLLGVLYDKIEILEGRHHEQD